MLEMQPLQHTQNLLLLQRTCRNVLERLWGVCVFGGNPSKKACVLLITRTSNTRTLSQKTKAAPSSSALPSADQRTLLHECNKPARRYTDATLFSRRSSSMKRRYQSKALNRLWSVITWNAQWTTCIHKTQLWHRCLPRRCTATISRTHVHVGLGRNRGGRHRGNFLFRKRKERNEKKEECIS